MKWLKTVNVPVYNQIILKYNQSIIQLVNMLLFFLKKALSDCHSIIITNIKKVRELSVGVALFLSFLSPFYHFYLTYNINKYLFSRPKHINICNAFSNQSILLLFDKHYFCFRLLDIPDTIRYNMDIITIMVANMNLEYINICDKQK